MPHEEDRSASAAEGVEQHREAANAGAGASSALDAAEPAGTRDQEAAQRQRLADQLKLSIWWALRSFDPVPRKPLTRTRAGMLSSTSRAALFWGMGGPMHPLTVETHLIRAGLATGVLGMPRWNSSPAETAAAKRGS